MNSTDHPPSGLWKPYGVKNVYYGNNVVNDQLLSLLPTPTSRAAIITGHSLTTKTPLIQELEQLLGPDHHALTFSSIKEHSPVLDLKAAAHQVSGDSSIDTLISVGGGSPIDSTKWIAIKVRELRGDSTDLSADEGYLVHITIPTTLSAAECTPYAAYTNEDGQKVAIGGHQLLCPIAILYDPHYTSYTPTQLWLATGLRALDHAIELMYHSSSTEVPCKHMCMQSVSTLFQDLRLAKSSHKGDGSSTADDAETSIRLLLAAFGSLGFLGYNMTSGLGLSHALGYALGAAYGIPHGETSCVTLGAVVKLKARGKSEDAEQIARLLPYATGMGSVWAADRCRTRESPVKDAVEVGNAVIALVEDLGLKRTLKDYGVAEGEVDNIVTRALGGKVGGAVSGVDETVFEQVKTLVTSLY